MNKTLTTCKAVLAVAVAMCSLMRVAEAAGASKPTDFRQWAVTLVAGSNHAHSGAPSQVFDNARRELATSLAQIGFQPQNMIQFSLNDEAGTLHTSIAGIADAMTALADRAPAGCLIYFTSHGTRTGMILDDTVLDPGTMHDMVDSACGTRPAVIVMSSCYSGQFTEPLLAPNRVVITASRPDRTSFGCGELDHYTYFDDCFLRTLPQARDFARLGVLLQTCVSAREQEMHIATPSEPQIAVGRHALFALTGGGPSP